MKYLLILTGHTKGSEKQFWIVFFIIKRHSDSYDFTDKSGIACGPTY